MIWIDNAVHHFLVWNKSQVNSADDLRFHCLAHQLSSMRTWLVDGERAVTHNFRRHQTYPGFPCDSLFYVCGFVVVRGDVDRAMALAAEIDWSFLKSTGTGIEAEAELEAFCTISFLPVKGMNASLMTLWRRNSDCASSPGLSLGIIVGILDAFNVWVRRLRRVGSHLDSARMNVRIDAFHFEHGHMRHGRSATGSLMGLGTYPPPARPLEDAITESGLEDDRFTVEVSRTSGWWSSRPELPSFHDRKANLSLI
jgi:hypothetical protein